MLHAISIFMACVLPFLVFFLFNKNSCNAAFVCDVKCKKLMSFYRDEKGFHSHFYVNMYDSCTFVAWIFKFISTNIIYNIFADIWIIFLYKSFTLLWVYLYWLMLRMVEPQKCLFRLWKEGRKENNSDFLNGFFLQIFKQFPIFWMFSHSMCVHVIYCFVHIDGWMNG